MEERKHVDQGSERRIRTFFQNVFCYFRVGRSHVQLQSIWRLCNNLQAPLQDAKGELVRRLGRQPQSEVLVRLVNFLQDLLQRLQPPGDVPGQPRRIRRLDVVFMSMQEPLEPNLGRR